MRGFPRGLLQRLTCYLEPIARARPGGRTNRMQRMRLDLENQIADRPPALLDLGRYPGGSTR